MNWKAHVKACIFDLDGVIVDTAKYHFQAWRNLAKGFGFNFDETFNEKLKGVSRAGSLTLILDAAGIELSKEDFNNALIEKNDEYLGLIEDMDKREILPGVLRYLTILVKNEIPLALGSASKNARTILETLELLDFFDFISDGNSVKKGKPHPETFLACSKHFGLDPSECIVFEDSIKGIQAAKNGGFQSVGIGNKETLSLADDCYLSFAGKHPQQLSTLFTQTTS